MIKPFIYLDMDGVLANWEAKAKELIGDDWRAEVQKANWGGLYSYKDLFAIIEPMDDALELYDACLVIAGSRERVQILTALPNRANFPSAAQDKINWIHKHIHPEVRVNFGPRAQDKQWHCQNGDVLIDDKERNIVQWVARGGCGIIHTSARDSIIKLTQ